MELIKANLNLYAVLRNLEDLVKYDPEMAELAADWDISLQFTVLKGPVAGVSFKNGECSVVRGRVKSPSVRLFFTSPAHLNKMFDNKANPIPLKGFTKLGFLMKDFPKLTERLEYYLKPTDELLKNKDYLEMNTRLTLNTAAYAVRELASLDSVGAVAARRIKDGVIQLLVSPGGPAVYISFEGGSVKIEKAVHEKPMAVMEMKGLKTANDFLNGRIDSFSAVASGKVLIKGQISMLDEMGLILDRIPLYL